MKIQVREDHIAEGKKNNSDQCPVALAIKGQVCGFAEIVVGSTTIHLKFEDPLRYWSTQTSAVAKEFIDRFDAGLPVDSFEFELELPDPNKIPVYTPSFDS